jgi:hypothetical protein
MRLKNVIIITSIIVVAAAVTFVATYIQPSRNTLGGISIDSQTAKIAQDSSPNPLDGSKNYAVRAGLGSSSDSSPGIIALSGLRPGTYNLTASEAPAGYYLTPSKLIDLTTKHTTTSAFVYSRSNSNGTSNETQLAKEVSYNVKFICGSVSGNEGPLRPGRYDTDISIYNNQGYTVPFLWNAVSNNGTSTTSILKTLQSATSSGIACKDLLQLFNVQNTTSNLLEGFVIVRPQISAGGLASFSGNSATIPALPQSENQLSPLTVQVFYSANALPSLPHDITMDKILFSILNDTSSKIPRSLLGKELDITIQSQPNQILDPESEVKDMLASKYKISAEDLMNLKIRIISVGLGVTSMIDDHAISSLQVMPQTVS